MAKKKVNKFVNIIKQRRLWAALSGAVSIFFGVMGWIELASAAGAVAGALGAWSYYKPK